MTGESCANFPCAAGNACVNDVCVDLAPAAAACTVGGCDADLTCVAGTCAELAESLEVCQ